MFPRGWTSLDFSVILPDGSGNRFWKAWQGTVRMGGGEDIGCDALLVPALACVGEGVASRAHVLYMQGCVQLARASIHRRPFFFFSNLTGKAFAFLGYLIING